GPEPGTPAAAIGRLLNPTQILAIEVLSQASGELSPEQMSQLIAVLNDVAGKAALYEAPEFASISGPDASVVAGWTNKLFEFFGRKTPPATDTVADLRQQLAEKPDSEKTRRLNKLLIAGAFPAELRKARVSLLTISTWRPVKVRFQTLNATEPFMIWMKAALTTGLVIASPYLFYQIWIFV